jgi:aspartate/methionine/tyrosine aminotransferase
MVKPFLSERMQGIERTLLRQINDQADSSCINLGLGEPSFPTPKSILNHLKQKVDDWNLGYSPNEGIQKLRKLIAEKSGFEVTADQICVTVGAEEALFTALMVIMNSGDEVLIPDPGFPAYESIVKIAGGIAKSYQLYRENNFSLKYKHVEKNITNKTKAIILNSPNNPSGAVYSSEELMKLAELLEKRSIIAISDEVYRDIYFEERPDSIANYVHNYVVVNSLSKSYSMTGWRLGWCIAPPELSKPLANFHQLAVACAPKISQKVALFALKGFAEKEKMRNIEELRRRRDLAMRCVEKYTDLEFVKPSGTFYLFIDVLSKIPKYGNSLEISLSLLSKEKVVTIPGLAFGKGGEGYLRISFASSPEQIEEGIRRVGHFFGIRLRKLQ